MALSSTAAKRSLWSSVMILSSLSLSESSSSLSAKDMSAAGVAASMVASSCCRWLVIFYERERLLRYSFYFSAVFFRHVECIRMVGISTISRSFLKRRRTKNMSTKTMID